MDGEVVSRGAHVGVGEDRTVKGSHLNRDSSQGRFEKRFLTEFMSLFICGGSQRDCL